MTRAALERALPLTRREVLQKLALALGGTLSLPVIGAGLSCRRPPPEALWSPRTLTPAQSDLVALIAETILPATDTPGAREAGVHEFIDLLLTDWMSAEERDRFLDGLTAFDTACHEETGSPFATLTPERRLAVLRPLDEAAVEARNARESDDDPLPFFGSMKEMTLVGYYTSEVGMTRELQHRLVFQSFEGCVTVDHVGRAWA